MAHDVAGAQLPDLPRDAADPVRDELETLRARSHGENPAAIRTALADTMMDDVGVYRTGEGLKDAVARVRELKERYRDGARPGQGQRVQHGPARDARAGLPARLRRGRGGRLRWRARRAVARTPARTTRSATTSEWLKHTLAYRTEAGPELRYKPVTITTFQPKPRVY